MVEMVWVEGGDERMVKVDEVDGVRECEGLVGVEWERCWGLGIREVGGRGRDGWWNDEGGGWFWGRVR